MLYFTCYIVYKKIQSIYHRNILRENLLILRKFLNKHKIRYIIDCGTLLGAVRDKDIILGDQDVDINVDKRDIPIIRKNLEELRELGFKEWRNKDDNFMAMSLTQRSLYRYIYRNFIQNIIKFKI